MSRAEWWMSDVLAVHAADRLVLHVRRRRDGRILYELLDETIGRSLLMGDLPSEMADYAASGELLIVMETPEVRNARLDRHQRAAAFHSHLDECERCRSRPFDLCAVGAELLRAATEGETAR